MLSFVSVAFVFSASLSIVVSVSSSSPSVSQNGEIRMIRQCAFEACLFFVFTL